MTEKRKCLTLTVPCYNSESYMERCVDSLLEGGDDVEIILVDDGSTDRTGEIADGYAAQYPDIVRVIHKENGGHGSGVNAGMALASGVYFKVVDSDDWLDAEAYHRLLAALRFWSRCENKPDLIVCNYVYDHLEEQTSENSPLSERISRRKALRLGRNGTVPPAAVSCDARAGLPGGRFV